MSSYLNIYIKRRSVTVSEQKMPCLLYYGTSIARELKNEIASLKYNDYKDYSDDMVLTEYEEKSEDTVCSYNLMDEVLIKDILDYCNTEIKKLTDVKNKVLTQNTKYEELAVRAEKTEVANAFLERVEDTTFYDEEIERFKELLRSFRLVYDFLEDNNYSFELVYTLD